MSIEEVTQNLHVNSVEENRHSFHLVGELSRHINSKLRITTDDFRGQRYTYLTFMKRISSQWVSRAIISIPLNQIPELIELLEKVK